MTARLHYRWAPQLDLLIERCTVHEPRKRPRLREVADELAAMVGLTGELTIVEGTEELERRIAAMTERHRRRDENRDAFNSCVTRAWQRLVEEVAQPAYQELAVRLPTFNTRHPVEVAMPRSLVTLPSVYLGGEAWGGMIIAPGEAGVRIDLGVALRVHEDAGRSTIAAVIEVHRHNQGRGHRVSILEHMAETRLGTARFDATLIEIRNAYAACLPETLARLADALDAER